MEGEELPAGAAEHGNCTQPGYDEARSRSPRPRDMSLTNQLESIVARATAVTLGTDTSTSADALLAESNPLWGQLGEHAAELLPVVDRLMAKLKGDLAGAPAAVKSALEQHRSAEAEAKFDRVDAPREVVGFQILDALERIRSFMAKA